MPRTGMTPAQIREKAIDHAIARMRKQGFDKVRLVDIAKDLGVSHALLYGHFADKSALLDAVSERWLRKIDEAHDLLCRSKKNPVDKIHDWFLLLHQQKREKVLNDPELYKAFNLATETEKPFVRVHLENVNRQLLGLVNEAIAAKKIRAGNPATLVKIIWETTMGFHHPKLVAQHLEEKREALLRLTLEVVLKGLK
jgi:AcrR family transcriptional regulator